MFRIAELFIGGANSTKLLWLALRRELAHELKIGTFDVCFAGLTREPEHIIWIAHRLRKSVGIHLYPPHRNHRATRQTGCVHAAYHAHRAVPTDQRAIGLESATALRPAQLAWQCQSHGPDAPRAGPAGADATPWKSHDDGGPGMLP